VRRVQENHGRADPAARCEGHQHEPAEDDTCPPASTAGELHSCALGVDLPADRLELLLIVLCHPKDRSHRGPEAVNAA
jgi:hypothetical protein